MSPANQRRLIAVLGVAVLLVALWRWLRPAPDPTPSAATPASASGRGAAPRPPAGHRGAPRRPERVPVHAGAAGGASRPSGAERPQLGGPAPPVAAVVDVDRSAERAADLERRGSYADALVEADRCLARAPGRDDCLAVARFSAARTGDFERAYPLLVDCLRSHPEDVECLSGMVPTRLWRGEPSEARAAANTLARVDPDGHWTHLVLGQVHEDAGEVEAAEAEFEQACTQGHDYACRRAAALSGAERAR